MIKENSKSKKAALLNAVVAGRIDPKTFIYRSYTKYVGFEEGKSGFRYHDTGELVPPEIIERDMASGEMWKHKGVSYSDDDRVVLYVDDDRLISIDDGKKL